MLRGVGALVVVRAAGHQGVHLHSSHGMGGSQAVAVGVRVLICGELGGQHGGGAVRVGADR